MPKRSSPAKAKAATRDRALEPTRVVLSSHQALVRSGIRALLERIKEIEVREALDNQQLLTLIQDFNPHVILLDVVTRGLQGLVLLKQVVQKFPSARVLVLTQDEDGGKAVEVLRLGAAGLITESATSTELAAALRTVARGENYRSERLRQVDLEHSEDPPAFLSRLTPRQYEVLKMISEGHGTKEIAVRLNISTKTVETHRARTMKRLNIRDIAGLVRYAVRMGLIKLDE